MTFDEDHLVANAGLLLVATVVRVLGLEALIDASVRLPSKRGGFRPGRKVLTLVHAMVAGATHIDHADLLRAGASEEVLGHAVMAPSTLGTFLRAFTFGHLRQLDAVLAETLRRVWERTTLPERLVVDIDSTVCEVEGAKKAGASYAYTKVLAYNPLLASRADTGEVLHARMRTGSANTQRGAIRFVEELVARLRRAGVHGELVVRFDAGFWNNKLLKTLKRLGVHYTMGTRMVAALVSRVDEIAEYAWRRVPDFKGGVAEVAECRYDGRRVIVRRVRNVSHQEELFPTWRYLGFVTDLKEDALEVDAFHRDHATVELDIRDLKEGSGLEHCPSGNFSANGAWLLCAVLAHNLVRWTQLLGGVGDATPGARPHVARTLRTRVVSMPGRLVNRSGRLTLRAPTNWPWRDTFTRSLHRLRSLSVTVT